MLLKGVMEVETAPDRRAAAEMVLIRLCHVADLPTPGDLVRRLIPCRPAVRPHPHPHPRPRHPAAASRAVANGPPITMAEPAPAGPRLSSFRDVAALVAERREAMLHGHLVHSVHLVRFAPPVIELRPQPEAPRDLAPRLAKLLLEATGARWTIAVSAAPGEPTLAEQGNAADAARRATAADHPLVRAILAAFPGARIEAVADAAADAYGLPAEPEPDIPAFAPIHAEPADDDAPPDDDFLEFDE